MKVFATAIINAIPRVLLSISDLCGAMILGITSFNDKLWQSGFDLFMQFINGIKSLFDKIKNIVEKVKTIIKNVLEKLKGEAKQWGIDMLTGFANGIMERLGHLKAKVEEVANSIRSKLHFSRPDEGPLRDYETWMPDMVKGLTESLDRAMPMLTDKMNELAFNMSPSLNGNINSIGPSVNVVVNSNYEQDPLGQMVSSIKTFSNGAKNDYNYGYGG